MRKAHNISFDMDDQTEDISDYTMEVEHNFYTKKTSYVSGSLKFAIPIEIKTELNLKASDMCYFVKYTEGYYISFKEEPECVLKKNIRFRKLSKAGMYDTLFVCIPQFIKEMYPTEIKYVQLLRPKGFKRNEWQIRFYTTEYF